MNGMPTNSSWNRQKNKNIKILSMALHIKTNISIKQSFDLTETNSLSFIKFHLLAIKIKNMLE